MSGIAWSSTATFSDPIGSSTTIGTFPPSDYGSNPIIVVAFSVKNAYFDIIVKNSDNSQQYVLSVNAGAFQTAVVTAWRNTDFPTLYQFSLNDGGSIVATTTTILECATEHAEQAVAIAAIITHDEYHSFDNIVNVASNSWDSRGAFPSYPPTSESGNMSATFNGGVLVPGNVFPEYDPTLRHGFTVLAGVDVQQLQLNYNNSGVPFGSGPAGQKINLIGIDLTTGVASIPIVADVKEFAWSFVRYPAGGVHADITGTIKFWADTTTVGAYTIPVCGAVLIPASTETAVYNANIPVGSAGVYPYGFTMTAQASVVNCTDTVQASFAAYTDSGVYTYSFDLIGGNSDWSNQISASNGTSFVTLALWTNTSNTNYQVSGLIEGALRYDVWLLASRTSTVVARGRSWVQVIG